MVFFLLFIIIMIISFFFGELFPLSFLSFDPFHSVRMLCVREASACVYMYAVYIRLIHHRP